MSVEGFNLQRKRRIQSKSDFILIHFDPKETSVEEVEKLMEAIGNIPDRRNGTIFTVEPEGIWFRRV